MLDHKFSHNMEIGKFPISTYTTPNIHICGIFTFSHIFLHVCIYCVRLHAVCLYKKNAVREKKCMKGKRARVCLEDLKNNKRIVSSLEI